MSQATNCCDGSGWAETVDEAGRAWRRPCPCLADRTRLAALGPRFAQARFDLLESEIRKLGRQPHKTVLVARDVMAAAPNGSYFLWGDYGAWKTYLAAAQFNALLDSHGFGWPKFLTDDMLYRSLRSAELDEGDPVVTVKDVERGAVRHLIVDDLGKKKISPFIRQSYFALFDAVYRQGGQMGLTITCQVPLAQLRQDDEGYEPGMIRRLDHLCQKLEVRK